jgi:hypothetical protein
MAPRAEAQQCDDLPAFLGNCVVDRGKYPPPFEQ